MNMRKAIKKAVALTAGAVMLGATLAGAMATTLADYPAPFVKNGVYDAVIVVGNSAAAEDIVGAIDMAASLQYAMRQTSTVSTGGTTTTVEGGVAVETAGQKLYYNDWFNETKSSMTKTEFPTLLGDQTFSDDDGTELKVTQKLVVPSSKITFGKSTPNTNNPIIYADFSSSANNPAYQMVFTFPTAMNASKLVSTQPTITLMGVPYTASGVASEMSGTKLTLYGGGIDKTVTAGESVTVTIDGSDVEVSVAGVNTQTSTSTAMITIGSESKQVTAGNTYTIGGHRVYVRDVFAYTTPVASGAVRMFLGTDKLVLENGQQVAKGTGSTYVSGSMVNVYSSGANGKITAINITMTPNGMSPAVEHVALGGEYTDPVFGALKFVLSGQTPEINDTARDYIELSPSSNDKGRLVFTNKDGADYSMNVFLGNASNGVYGDCIWNMNDNKAIWMDTSAYIGRQEYFVVGSSGYSHILQLNSITNSSSDHKIVVQDIGSADSNSWTWTDGGTSGTGTMTYNGVDYPFTVDFQGSGNANSFKIKVTTGAVNYVWTQHGSLITLPILYNGTTNCTNMTYVNMNGLNVTVTEESAYNDEGTPNDYGIVNIPLTYVSANSADDFRFSQPSYKASAGVATGSWAGFVQVGSSYDYESVTPYGTYLYYNTNNYRAKAEYPGSEVYYRFFVAPTSAVTSTTGTGSVSTTSIEKINVGAAKLASEISDAKAQNVISVGGPCVNAVSATLMGLPANSCGAESTIPENKAIIKLFTNGNYEGLVVAGWNAMDTQRATRVLSDYASYTADLVGTEVVVTGTNLVDITVSAPEPEVEEEPEPEATV